MSLTQIPFEYIGDASFVIGVRETIQNLNDTNEICKKTIQRLLEIDMTR